MVVDICWPYPFHSWSVILPFGVTQSWALAAIKPRPDRPRMRTAEEHGVFERIHNLTLATLSTIPFNSYLTSWLDFLGRIFILGWATGPTILNQFWTLWAFWSNGPHSWLCIWMCLSTIKIKPPKMNIYRQYFYFYFSLIYYLVITLTLK